MLVRTNQLVEESGAIRQLLTCLREPEEDGNKHDLPIPVIDDIAPVNLRYRKYQLLARLEKKGKLYGP